jgi:hypothetical protein
MVPHVCIHLLINMCLLLEILFNFNSIKFYLNLFQFSRLFVEKRVQLYII